MSRLHCTSNRGPAHSLITIFLDGKMRCPLTPTAWLSPFFAQHRPLPLSLLLLSSLIFFPLPLIPRLRYTYPSLFFYLFYVLSSFVIVISSRNIPKQRQTFPTPITPDGVPPSNMDPPVLDWSSRQVSFQPS